MNSSPATIPARFLETAANCGSATAIQEGEIGLSFKGLAIAAANVGERIGGATKAQNVGLCLPNGAGFGAGFFGISLCGKTVVPVNFLLKPDEIAGIVGDSEIDTVLTTEALAAGFEAAGLKILLVEEILRDIRPCEVRAPKARPDDVAVLLYTAGTVGEPKGVMQTHSNILANIDGCLEAMALSRDDVFLGVLPLFHTFGLTCSFLVPLLTGSKVVMMQRFSPASIPPMLRQHRVSIIIAAPSMYRAMLKALAEQEATPEGLRLCVSGGEALSETLAERFRAITGVPLLEGYGMTEHSPVISLNRLVSPRPGTVGRPLHNVEVRVIDSEGVALAAGESGEICVRGECVMKGYWRRPEETRSVIDGDKWLHTGDIGRLDEEGCISVTGRIKELIISAGRNISPGEIEGVLEAHPGVNEAAVIGVPDEVRGEVPRAFVIPGEGSGDLSAEELTAHCRRRLADYKRPRSFSFVEAFPRSMTGKVLKRLLKDG